MPRHVQHWFVREQPVGIHMLGGVSEMDRRLFSKNVSIRRKSPDVGRAFSSGLAWRRKHSLTVMLMEEKAVKIIVMGQSSDFIFQGEAEPGKLPLLPLEGRRCR